MGIVNGDKTSDVTDMGHSYSRLQFWSVIKEVAGSTSSGHINLHTHTLNNYFSNHLLRSGDTLLRKSDPPWLVWLNGLSTSLHTKRSPVQFLVRAHAWVAGQIPSWEGVRGNRLMYLSCTSIFLSLSFSLLSSLSKKKWIKSLKKKNKGGQTLSVHHKIYRPGVDKQLCQQMQLPTI